MPSTLIAKRRKFSLASLKAGDRLLKEIKDEFRKEGKQINYDQLRKEGYSEAMIERLKEL